MVTESNLARGPKQKVSSTRLGWPTPVMLYALTCLGGKDALDDGVPASIG
jgi:hypothetical protein